MLQSILWYHDIYFLLSDISRKQGLKRLCFHLPDNKLKEHIWQKHDYRYALLCLQAFRLPSVTSKHRHICCHKSVLKGTDMHVLHFQAVSALLGAGMLQNKTIKYDC